MTRASLVMSCVLYAGFGILDVMGTLTKYTVIAAHVLLLLALSDCGAVWSADAWRRRRCGEITAGPPTSPVWPRRLLQIFIGIVYVGAAFTKMHTPAYFSGDQLTFWMLADMNFENRLGEFLTLYPALLTIMAYVTILWEILFVFLVWSPVWRVPALALGVVFHALTYFTLGLVVFPLVYLAVYLAFVEPAEVERAAVFARRLMRKLGLKKQAASSPAALGTSVWFRPEYAVVGWGMLLASAAVIGVEVEHRRDVYQERGPGGPLALTPLDADTARAMLGPPRRLRPQDMYFAFDVGTSMLGGVLSDRRDAFSVGERALIQCSLQPPHPDMWIELNLYDSEDRVLRRIGQVVPREDLRANFFYDFDEAFPPGEYAFVLRYDGEELTRRRITVQGTAPALTASR
jgi:hypothetical protein